MLAAVQGDDALADLAHFKPPTREDAEPSPEPVEPVGAFLMQLGAAGHEGLSTQRPRSAVPGRGTYDRSAGGLRVGAAIERFALSRIRADAECGRGGWIG